jgi:hypothetical protein
MVVMSLLMGMFEYVLVNVKGSKFYVTKVWDVCYIVHQLHIVSHVKCVREVKICV